MSTTHTACASATPFHMRRSLQRKSWHARARCAYCSIWHVAVDILLFTDTLCSMANMSDGGEVR